MVFLFFSVLSSREQRKDCMMDWAVSAGLSGSLPTFLIHMSWKVDSLIHSTLTEILMTFPRKCRMILTTFQKNCILFICTNSRRDLRFSVFLSSHILCSIFTVNWWIGATPLRASLVFNTTDTFKLYIWRDA